MASQETVARMMAPATKNLTVDEGRGFGMSSSLQRGPGVGVEQAGAG
jgi:hypothetical protein